MIGLGSDWSKPDGTITANTPEAIEAVSWILRYLDEKLAPTGLGVGSARQLFSDGKVAMMFEGPWLMGQVEKTNPELLKHISYEVAPTPTHAAITGGAFYVIPKGSDHKDEACTLLTSLTAPDAQRAWLESTNQIPGTVVEPSSEYLAKLPWVKNMIKVASEHAAGLGYSTPGYEVNGAEFRQMVVDTLSRIFSHSVSVEDGLNELQDRLESWSKTL